MSENTAINATLRSGSVRGPPVRHAAQAAGSRRYLWQ